MSCLLLLFFFLFFNVCVHGHHRRSFYWHLVEYFPLWNSRMVTWMRKCTSIQGERVKLEPLVNYPFKLGRAGSFHQSSLKYMSPPTPSHPMPFFFSLFHTFLQSAGPAWCGGGVGERSEKSNGLISGVRDKIEGGSAGTSANRDIWSERARSTGRNRKRGWRAAARQAADSWWVNRLGTGWDEEVPSGCYDFAENKCQCYKQPKPELISAIAFTAAVH